MPATPVKEDVGFVGVPTLPPAPETMLQLPVPEVGVLPAKFVDVPQSDWSGPALEVVGLARRVMITSSVEAVQGALEMVQRRV